MAYLPTGSLPQTNLIPPSPLNAPLSCPSPLFPLRLLETLQHQNL